MRKRANGDLSDLNGDTPLMRASNKGYADVVNTLLTYGVDPNQSNRLGVFPLYLAAQEDKVEVITELLSNEFR